MIEIRDLAFRNLRIPELTLRNGTSAVIGPNGSGKTSLLRLLSGLTIPDSGTISIDGRDPGAWPTGFVNEYPDRNALFTRVYDELAGPLRFRKLPCAAIPEMVHGAAAKAGLAHFLDRAMETLSGGEKVLVAVQSAIIFHPRIIILDEFDSHLDPETLSSAERLIEDAGADYIIRCTQNMDLASRCDAVVALFHGTVHESGTAQKVFHRLSGTCYYPFSWRLCGEPRS
jgi:energy-coupling factor transport system ATP-binding protein